MARRYTLETKIHALNQLDVYDGDMLRISDELTIPATTLQAWRKNETDLRHDYRQKQERQLARDKSDLQAKMIQKSLAIVDRIDDDLLNNAPLNQLATALGSLVNHAQKLEEATEDTDEQEEKIIRIEYFYDGKVQDAPPWAETSSESSSSIQDSGVRSEVGQNGTGQNRSNEQRDERQDAWLVASPNLSDVESSLEGIEDEYRERDWYHD